MKFKMQVTKDDKVVQHLEVVVHDTEMNLVGNLFSQAVTHFFKTPNSNKNIKKESKVFKEESAEVTYKYLKEGQRALVAFRCPDCGRLYIGMHTYGETIVCKGCSRDVKVPGFLIFTKVDCACGNNFYLYTEKTLNELPCRVCGQSIELKEVEEGDHVIKIG